MPVAASRRVLWIRIDEAALADRLLAAPGTAAANRVATPRDVRSRRWASRRLVGLSSVSRARLEMLRPIGGKFDMWLWIGH
jgi:hypothetical protein